MMTSESDFKLIIKAMGGNLVSIKPEIYAVWTKGCKDPARYLFTYISDVNNVINTEEIFENIRLKFSHDIYIIVTEKSIIMNGRPYNIESSDSPDGDIIRLFMELIRKRENFK